MEFYSRINRINSVIQEYFVKHPFEQDVLAKELMSKFISAGVYKKDHRNGLPLRKDLRKLDERNELLLIPLLFPDRKETNTRWYFTRMGVDVSTIEKNVPFKVKPKLNKSGRKGRDEHYVIDLCDEVLNLAASRQHTFDFLLGDLHKDGIGRTKLPVDAFYETLNLVVEFMEKQHTESVTHFDKPDIITVSGVSRGEQRKIYDHRRHELILKNNIDLVNISYSDFEYNRQKKIIRNRSLDLEIVKNILSKHIEKNS